MSSLRLIIISALAVLFIMNANAESGKIAYIIKLEGKKGAGNDFYLIGGKNCDTPTLIKKGKGKSGKRGKIIIIEKECEPMYPQYGGHSYMTKIPIFVPVSSPYGGHSMGGHSMGGHSMGGHSMGGSGGGYKAK